MINDKHLKALRPYLVGSEPGPDGEWDLHCPLHDDANRSARLNVDGGVWYCHASCGGGTVADLIARRSDWIAPPTDLDVRSASAGRRMPPQALSEADVARWHDAFRDDEGLVSALSALRNIGRGTLLRFEIGFDSAGDCYTIPVRDADGTLVNVRRYQPFPTPGRRRGIWNTTGHGTPARLWPIDQLAAETIIVCEGEFDCLSLIDRGFAAITKTSGAKTWRGQWSPLFAGKTVYVCHDCDRPGQDANAKIARQIARHAAEVRTVRLPFEITDDHGQDVTDFFAANDAPAFQRLLDEAEPYAAGVRVVPAADAPERATIADAADATRVGEPLRIPLTIKGKHSSGFAIPKKVVFTCTRDAGAACQVCPLFDTGKLERQVSNSDPACLGLIDITDVQRDKVLRGEAGIPSCKKLAIDIAEHQSVETLFARPSLDAEGDSGDLLRTLKVTSVGRHDTPPNATVEIVGALYPSPRTQGNEFLAWDVAKVRTSVDHFEPTPDVVKRLMRFQPGAGQSPLGKAVEIADDMSAHVTGIYDRRELHVAIDLVFHSALSFAFNGDEASRGYLDILVVGDTRTGKSETAHRLARHYQSGEIISCESASIAGVLAAVQQFGGKEWSVTWGAIPINDRRLVVLDEVSGLEPHEIGQLSDARSNGLVRVQKVSQDVANARTRLIWIGNPRQGSMSNFTYGVQAIRPLIGQPEDIARFDLALSLASDDVQLSRINRKPPEGRIRYETADCAALVRWVWSRRADQVVFEPGVEDRVLEYAQVLGEEYIADPPLIQGADARKKIARLAVALAARTFSTDGTYTRIVVDHRHVDGAVKFIRRVYGAAGFGYAELSARARESRELGEGKAAEVAKWLREQGQLRQFLIDNPSFKRPDLEETLNMSREEANAVISHLWEARMLRKQAGTIIVQPVLHRVLRSEK